MTMLLLPAVAYVPPEPTPRPVKRSHRPKLSLSMPTGSLNTATSALSGALMTPRSPRSPRSPLPPCQSPAYTPLTLAARNAVLNQRGFNTLQIPTFAYVNAAPRRSILKRDSVSSVSSVGSNDSSSSGGADAASPSTSTARHHKSIRFCDSPTVEAISPLPAECHGILGMMSKEERRWRRD